MFLQLYDKNHHKIAGLAVAKAATVESVLSTGDGTLSFLYPIEGAAQLVNEAYIRTKTDEYIIKEVQPDSSDLWCSVKATLNVEDLEGICWPRFESVEQRIDDCLKLAIAGTGWAIGSCTVTRRRTIRKTECSGWDIIQQARKTYRCEIWFDTIEKKIHIAEKRGQDKGMYFTDILNLRKLAIQSTSYDFCTRIKAEGKDGLTFKEINGGKDYVENHQYSNKVLTKYWKDERYTNAQSLLEDTTAKLEELSKPIVAYSGDILDLAKASPKTYRILDFGLGDTVELVDSTTGTKEKQRIVKMVEYPDEPEKNTCEFANRTASFEEIQQEQNEVNSTVNNITSDDGKISPAALDFEAIDIHVQNIYAQELNAIKARIGDLEVTTLKATTLIANTAKIEQLFAEKATVQELTAAVGRIAILETGMAEINTAMIKLATIEQLNAANANIEKLLADNATINQALILKADIKDLKAIEARIATAEIEVAKIGTLSADVANLKNVVIDVAHLSDLTAINASIKALQTEDAAINKLVAGKASIADLNAANANITNLKANVGSINTLLAGGITSANIQAGGITSDSLTIRDGFITNAMIGSVAAGKITAGKINTTLVEIGSANGNLVIKDNTIQIKEGATVRVQIGKDAGGEYSMYVWDKSGGLMFDAIEGLHAPGIKTGIIRNDMVADNANIAGTKIDIQSLVTTINGGTTKIDSSIVQMDSAGQTLKVAFSSMTNTVNSVSGVANAAKTASETNTTAINVQKGRIDTLIQNTTITKDGKTVQLKDEYQRTVQTVEGIQTTIGNQQSTIDTVTGSITSLQKQQATFEQSLSGLSSSVTSLQSTIRNKADNSTVTSLSNQVSSLSMDLSGFKTTVSSTYETKTVVAGIKTTAESKAKVFTAQPVPPYKVGDIWAAGPSGEIMRCKTARASGAYTAADWEKAGKYTDDTKANQVAGNVTSLTTRTTTLESTMDGMTAEVTAIKKTVDTKADGSSVTSLSNTVSTLKNTVDGLSSNVTSLQTTVSKKADSSTVTAVTNRVGTLESTTSGLSQSVSSLQTTVNQKADSSTVTTIQNNVSTLTNDLNGFKTTVSNTYTTKTDFNNQLSLNQRTKQNGIELLDQAYNGDTTCKPFSSGTYIIVPATEITGGNANSGNLIKTVNAQYLYTDYIPANVEMPFYFCMDVYNAATTTGVFYIQICYYDKNKNAMATNEAALNIMGGLNTSAANQWQRFEGWSPVISDTDVRRKAYYVRIRYLPRYSGQLGTTYIRNVHWKQLGANQQTEVTQIKDQQASFQVTLTGLQGNFTSLQNTINTKADGTTVTAVTSRVGTLESGLNGLKSTVSSLQSTVSSKADSSTVTSLNTKVTMLESNLNGFKSTVSDTYVTKATFNDLNVGGRNLIKNTGFKTNWNAYSSYVALTKTDEGNKIVWNTAVQSAMTEAVAIDMVNGEKYTFSAEIRGNINSLELFILRTPTPNLMFSRQVNALSETIFQKIKVTFTYASNNAKASRIFIGGTASAVGQWIEVKKCSVKLEKGTITTDWTPAPEDIDASISAVDSKFTSYSTTSQMNSAIEQSKTNILSTVSNSYATKAQLNTVDGKFANYATTAAMNSAIDQKANQITQTVSQMYTTKTDFNNLSVGGRNYYKKTTPISLSGGAVTIDRNNAECPNGFYTVGIKEQTGNWRIGNVITSNGNWTISFEVRGSQNSAVGFYLDICDLGMIRITTTADNTWKKVEHTVNVTNHDSSPTVYNFVDMSAFSYAYFYIRNIKIEKGQKATDWTPAPEDIDASITAVDSKFASYSTTSQMNSAIDQKANQITQTVSQMYTTKTEFNNSAVKQFNNFSRTGNLTGWSPLANASGLDGVKLQSNGTYNWVGAITTSGNIQVYSDFYEVDANKSYKLGLTINKPAATGSIYFGITCYNASKQAVGVYTGTSTTLNTNFYYYSTNAVIGGWLNLEGYLMASNVDRAKLPTGKNVTACAVMHPTTKYVRIRFLNYYNSGTSSTMYFAHPFITDAENSQGLTDTSITTVTNKAATLETSVNGITSRVTAVETKATTTANGLTSLTSRVSTAESKLTATSLITTFTTAINGGTKFTTTKFTMDNTGLTIKGGGLRIQNNAGTNVLWADTNGNLQQRGDFYNYDSAGKLRASMTDSAVNFYDADGTFVSNMGATYIGTSTDLKGIRFYTSAAGKYFSWSFEGSSSTTAIGMLYAKEDVAGWTKGLHVEDSLYVKNGTKIDCSASQYVTFNTQGYGAFNCTGNLLLRSDGEIVLATKGTNQAMFKMANAGAHCYRHLDMHKYHINNIGNVPTSDPIQYFALGNKSDGSVYMHVQQRAAGAPAFGIDCWKSDERLKDNIQDTPYNAKNYIRQFKVRKFRWIESGYQEKFGLVAQEVEKVDAGCVFKVPQSNGDYSYQLEVNKFIPPLIKGVQEIIQENDLRDAKIEHLQREIGELKRKIWQLEQRLSVA